MSKGRTTNRALNLPRSSVHSPTVVACSVTFPKLLSLLNLTFCLLSPTLQAVTPEQKPWHDDEDPKHSRLEYRKHHRRFRKRLRNFIRHQHLLRAILSVKDILASRWYLPTGDCTRLILRKVGFVNILGNTQRHDLPLEELCPSDDTPKQDHFDFPNNTDTFGWNREYWHIYHATRFGSVMVKICS